MQDERVSDEQNEQPPQANTEAGATSEQATNQGGTEANGQPAGA